MSQIVAASLQYGIRIGRHMYLLDTLSRNSEILVDLFVCHV